MNAAQALAARQALASIADDALSALDGPFDPETVLQRIHALSTQALEELPETFTAAFRCNTDGWHDGPCGAVDCSLLPVEEDRSA